MTKLKITRTDNSVAYLRVYDAKDQMTIMGRLRNDPKVASVKTLRVPVSR